MATDVSGDVLRGLGVPYDLTSDHLWSDKATFTEQGPTVGQATPQGDYTLALQTAGTQSASKQLRIQAHRGGHPGAHGGAEFVYQYEGDTYWRGLDIQPTSNAQVIRTTIETATSTLKDPDAASFYSTDRSDRICIVYQRRIATGDRLQLSLRRPPMTHQQAHGALRPSTPTSTIPTDGYHPTVAYNRVDGYLYCCHWVYDNPARTSLRLRPIAARTERHGRPLVSTLSTLASTSPAVPTPMRSLGFAWRSMQGSAYSSRMSSPTTPRSIFATGSGSGSVHRERQRSPLSRSVGPSLMQWAGTQTSFSSHSVIQYDGGLFVSFPAVMIPIVTGNALYRVGLPSASTKLSSRVSNLFRRRWRAAVRRLRIFGSSRAMLSTTTAGPTSSTTPTVRCMLVRMGHGTAMRDSFSPQRQTRTRSLCSRPRSAESDSPGSMQATATPQTPHTPSTPGTLPPT